MSRTRKSASRSETPSLLKLIDELHIARTLVALVDRTVTSDGSEDDAFDRDEREGLWRVLDDAQQRLLRVENRLAALARSSDT